MISVGFWSIHSFVACEDLLGDAKVLSEVQDAVHNGELLFVRQVTPHSLAEEMCVYLKGIAQASLPNYQPIAVGSPNFHRVNRECEYSYVKGMFHQFTFFPWNQDVFNLFGLMDPVLRLKNRLNGFEETRFLGHHDDQGCVSKIAFQFYPRGGGYLNKHRDPIGFHQTVVAVMNLSTKGADFNSGGLVLESEGGNKLSVDDHLAVEDICFFKADMIHGVEAIDPEVPLDWLSFRGRWMALFAVNKVQTSQRVANSVDLDVR